MARIELRGVGHHYGDPSEPALKPLDLVCEDGVAYALLGPSGCGKTTLLNIISGLLCPASGQVQFDGVDVTRAPTRARNIAQVFQHPVIYDTMTVFDNLAFPLRNRGLRGPKVRSQVERIAALLELSGDLKRRASGLPAEMKQRLSLGRGLVREDVSAVLLDEPLTVIDPHLKWLLRRKLMEIHSELKLTLIYVTHDQLEALTLADEVIVLHRGEVLQQGTPQALFEAPAHTFVGHFIGSPGMNLVPCTLKDGHAEFPGGRMAVAARVSDAGVDGPLTLGIRPEFVQLHAEPRSPSALRAAVVRVDDLGRTKVVHARVAGQTEIAAIVPEDSTLVPSNPCWLEFPSEWTRFFHEDKALA